MDMQVREVKRRGAPRNPDRPQVLTLAIPTSQVLNLERVAGDRTVQQVIREIVAEKFAGCSK